MDIPVYAIVPLRSPRRVKVSSIRGMKFVPDSLTKDQNQQILAVQVTKSLVFAPVTLKHFP